MEVLSQKLATCIWYVVNFRSEGLLRYYELDVKRKEKKYHLDNVIWRRKQANECLREGDIDQAECWAKNAKDYENAHLKENG